MEWKRLQIVHGTEYIQLPDSFSEILIQVFTGNEVNFNAGIAHKSIITTTSRYLYMGNSEVNSIVDITDSIVHIERQTVNGVDTTSSAILFVFYK